MFRGLLILLLLILTLWMATSAVLPPSGRGSEKEDPQAIWRRTDEGWLRAETWLRPSDHLKHEPVPPLYPVALLPLIVAIGIVSLILGQPKKPTEAPPDRGGGPHVASDRGVRQNSARPDG